jgi:hypothetical protein
MYGFQGQVYGAKRHFVQDSTPLHRFTVLLISMKNRRHDPRRFS